MKTYELELIMNRYDELKMQFFYEDKISCAGRVLEDIERIELEIGLQCKPRTLFSIIGSAAFQIYKWCCKKSTETLSE